MVEVEVSVDAMPEVNPTDSPLPEVPIVTEEGPFEEGLPKFVEMEDGTRIDLLIGVSLSHLQHDHARRIAEMID